MKAEIQLFLDIEANYSKWEDHDRKRTMPNEMTDHYEILTMLYCCSCIYIVIHPKITVCINLMHMYIYA